MECPKKFGQYDWIYQSYTPHLMVFYILQMGITYHWLACLILSVFCGKPLNWENPCGFNKVFEWRAFHGWWSQFGPSLNYVGLWNGGSKNPKLIWWFYMNLGCQFQKMAWIFPFHANFWWYNISALVNDWNSFLVKKPWHRLPHGEAPWTLMKLYCISETRCDRAELMPHWKWHPNIPGNRSNF